MLLLLTLITTTLSTAIHGCPPIFEDPVVQNSISEEINDRLPKNVEPIRYNITLEPRLEPNLNPALFNGSVSIEFKALDNTKNITLHTQFLNISEVSISIVHENGSQVLYSNILQDDSNLHRNFYIILLKTPLIKGAIYVLTIGSYNGTLNHNNVGFYLAKYYDEGGIERRCATTQFQFRQARKAFPCFDEPHMKAKFVVHLIRSKNFTSISNEDLMYTKNLGNGRFQDIYKETVKMSTYLIAFVVSDYGHTNRTEGQRVFADQESVEKGEAEYTLRTGIEVLNSLQEYLNVNYSLQKMDQIAIPDNFFSPGGMENWGLVTYKKSIIVYPHKIATTREIQATLAMVAHEFAHQWFGNLVTCSWWKYIWLNEGFANYFQSYAASIVRPKWRLIDQFLLTSLQSALESDSSKYTEPMNHGDGPRTYIYYQKAGSVVRMFEHFLTQNIFRKSLTVYLNKKFDLYQALQQVVDAEGAGYLLGDLTVSSILKTWDSQAGYPVVTVTRNYKTGHVSLEQRRFFLEDQPLIDNNTWYIPINFHSLTNSNHNTAADFWMTERTQTVNQSFPNSSWLIVNKQQTGYYRVNYDQTNWNRLTVFLKTNDINSIHVLNRAQLIDDSFNLARAGQLDYNIPLNLSTYLRKETDFVPLTSFMNNLNFLNVMLAVTAEYSIFQSYINDLLEGAYRYLGPNELENDEHLDKLNRINVLNWLCNVGNVECRHSSLIKLRDWKENNRNLITPNLETPVFCGALRIGNQDDWDFLYQKYEVTENTSQRIRILNALGCSENKTTLNKFLDKVLQNNSSLQADDRVLAFKAVCNAGKTGLYSAIEYIDEHFLQLRTKVNLPAILEEIAAKFTTEKQLHQLVSRTNKHRESSMYDKVIQKTNENIRWSKQHIGTIKRWLVAYSIYQV